jgi:1-acyl-sn-glycerol-3-phosphate acyltransferase
VSNNDPGTPTGAWDLPWTRRQPARLVRRAVVGAVVRPGVAVLARPRVQGREHLAGLGSPALFCANHHSHADTPVLVAAIPAPWRHHLAVGAAADNFFTNPVVAGLSAVTVGAIPVERNRVSRRSLDLAAEVIDDGWSLVLYPEGQRSPEGEGRPFRGGAAYLSLRCSVPVVPVFLEGTGNLLASGTWLPRPTTTTVTFGPPLRPAAGDNARRLNRRIEAAVAALARERSSSWTPGPVTDPETSGGTGPGGDANPGGGGPPA